MLLQKKCAPTPHLFIIILTLINNFTISIGKNYQSWDIISNEIQNLKLPNVNFVLENTLPPSNRYSQVLHLKLGDYSIYKNFPFPDHNFAEIYSNCHTAMTLSRINPRSIMTAMVAFNEDPNYIIHISPYHERRRFNSYFRYYYKNMLTSILLYAKVYPSGFNTLSIVCYTCTPPVKSKGLIDVQNYVKKLIVVTNVRNISKLYKQLTKNLNKHLVEFVTRHKLWDDFPCSFKHSGLHTPGFTCPMTELRFRYNFTILRVPSSYPNRIGWVENNRYVVKSDIEERFTSPGKAIRVTWIKHGVDIKIYRYKLYALPEPISAASFLNILDALVFPLLIFFGGCFSLILYVNKTFVFAPFLWTVRMFLQQGVDIIIDPEKGGKVSKLRIFSAHLIISLWLFTAFIMSGMFGGEFFSICSTHSLPPFSKNLKQLSLTENIPIYTFTISLFKNESMNKSRLTSSLRDVIIPQKLDTDGYSPSYLKLLEDISTKIKWYRSTAFYLAKTAALRGVLYINETHKHWIPKTFAVMDVDRYLNWFEISLGIFRKHFIISNSDANFDTDHEPWYVSRNLFGVILEENLAYLEQSGVIGMWENNYGDSQFLIDVKRQHKNWAKTQQRRSRDRIGTN
ncbi:hypothetical protein Fcan01_23623 [Folsomia candida]|uniref:Uncharacterized protein n=1 Tax=Folsomia candida TaxID=158441 RepID=A0A226D883_FOLCA|nr:hypothetical protein Fcan01_23623 [Folsomia candida]